MNLVLIETSSNQRYIFSTNRLRENVGASELTYLVGTEFVLRAVSEVAHGVNLFDEDDEEFRRKLLDPSLNPPLVAEKEWSAEVIVATSGKAILLVDSERTGRSIVHRVTARVCEEAPGLTVHGAIGQEIDSLDNAEEIHRAIGQVHERLEMVRFEVPSQQERFLRLPFVAPCDSSGLPAQAYDNRKPEGIKSAAVMSKIDSSESGVSRFNRVTRRIAPDVTLMENIEQMEKLAGNLQWISVIHADGNGLGVIFLDFLNCSGAGDGRDYLNMYRKFSLALDVCTTNAYGRAVNLLHERHQRLRIPVIPLVLGGDDLTVICCGRNALRFTLDFLRAFEDETSKTDEEHFGGIIPAIARKAFSVENGRLGICAGVAIVKPHFPFHSAYELSESLLKSAKMVKRKGDQAKAGPTFSAMDFHILYDSSGPNLNAIREKLLVDGGKTRLTAKPYVISRRAEETMNATAWLRNRTWGELENRAGAMRETLKNNDRGEKSLPSSQLHELREALFRGKSEADALMNLIRNRYKDKGFDALLCDRKNYGEAEGTPRDQANHFDTPNSDKSLFFESAPGKQETYFLDALDVVDFWE